MGWIKKQGPRHTCDKPPVYPPQAPWIPIVRQGDVWECDDCGQQYKVVVGTQGYYFVPVFFRRRVKENKPEYESRVFDPGY